MKDNVYTATRTWPESVWKTGMPFTQADIDKGEIRGEMECRGPWSILSSYRALAMEQTTENIDTTHYRTFKTTAKLYGVRSLLDLKQAGYELEGYVSIGGKRLRAFTSTAMFNVDGKLVDVAILYVCRPETEPTAEIDGARYTEAELRARFSFTDAEIENLMNRKGN